MDFDDLDLSELRQRRGEKWNTYGNDILAAWVADMDFAQAPPIRELLTRMVELSDLGYPVNPRTEGLPTVFAERAARCFGWKVDPRQVEVLTEVVQGLYIGLEVYSEPGDGVIIQTPIYPPFMQAAEQTGRRELRHPLIPGRDQWEIDFDRLRADAANASILMLCNPHNPTGRVFTRAELEGLAELALEFDWTILSDEIHADLVYPGHPHLPIATLGPEVEARTVTFMSASKAFNIAGLRCAVAAFGSDALRRSFRQVPPHQRGGLGTLGLAATQVAWEQCQGWLDELLLYLAANRDFAASFVAERLPQVRHYPVQGTYFLWLDCRELGLGDAPARHFLKHGKVALSDGSLFGDGGEGFARLNFATSRKILTQVLEAVAKTV